ncbi:ribonuclease III domain-containing protein [Sporobolomyces salmoneus]|uniref:ribonuclease III domain-containing protein n=1 Tax=Sporobolomyces salmoneus TaxID=183962 RepID=UPI003176A9A8
MNQEQHSMAGSTPSSTTPVPPKVSHNYSSFRSSLETPRSWEDPHLPISVEDLPSLPSVKDDELRERASTHRSFFTHPPDPKDRIKIDRDVQFRSYESLELVGDKHMASCAVQALTQRFPALPPFRMTELLGNILSNRTISYLSLGYKLHRHLRIAIIRHNAGRLDQKVCVDLFESHIGASLFDKQVSRARIEEWLFKVLSPRVFPTLEVLVKDWMEKHEEKVTISKSKRKATSQDLVSDPLSVEYEQVAGRVCYRPQSAKEARLWNRRDEEGSARNGNQE